MTDATASRLLILEATLVASAAGLADAGRLCAELPALPIAVLESITLSALRARRALERIGPLVAAAAALAANEPFAAAHAACDETPF